MHLKGPQRASQSSTGLEMFFLEGCKRNFWKYMNTTRICGIYHLYRGSLSVWTESLENSNTSTLKQHTCSVFYKLGLCGMFSFIKQHIFISHQYKRIKFLTNQLQCHCQEIRLTVHQMSRTHLNALSYFIFIHHQSYEESPAICAIPAVA